MTVFLGGFYHMRRQRELTEGKMLGRKWETEGSEDEVGWYLKRREIKSRRKGAIL